MTPELTPEMHAAMGQAILRARRYRIDNFLREGEWPLPTAIIISFTDMMRNSTPAGQATLVAAARRQARRHTLAPCRAVVVVRSARRFYERTGK